MVPKNIGITRASLYPMFVLTISPLSILYDAHFPAGSRSLLMIANHGERIWVDY
jgi:hypothetical protein